MPLTFSSVLDTQVQIIIWPFHRWKTDYSLTLAALCLKLSHRVRVGNTTLVTNEALEVKT